MGKHLLSVLGSSLYTESVYVCEEGHYETPYVQEALVKLKFTEWEPEDKITVFLTDEARKRNWLDRPYTKTERERSEERGIVLPEIKVGLESILRQDYAPFLDDPNACMIPIGANEEELWKIFQVVFDRIQEGETLYIDITHAFRSIPVQMLAVIHYARVVKHIQVEGIFYGAFEAGKDLGDGRKEVSIINMQAFLDILDWSQAAHSFVEYGSSDQIAELYRVQRRKKRPEGNQAELNRVIKEVENLTHGLETSRGYYSQNDPGKNKDGKSILESYRQYKTAYGKLLEKENQGTILKPLKELLQVIDRRVEVFDGDTNLETGMAAIQWAIDNKRTQQGFTALEETVKTFLCNYYDLDETKEYYRDGISKGICQSLLRKPDGKDDKDFTEEKRLEKYELWKENDYQRIVARNRIGEEEAAVLLEKAKKIFLTVPEELLPLIREIGNCRNSMNHFGYSNPGVYSCRKLDDKLAEFMKKWEEIVQTMEERKLS